MTCEPMHSAQAKSERVGEKISFGLSPLSWHYKKWG